MTEQTRTRRAQGGPRMVALAAFPRTFLREVVVEPVREGRPDPRQWSPPVRRVLLVSLTIGAVLLAALVGFALVAGQRAEAGSLDLARAAVAVGTTTVIYCLLAASARMPWGWLVPLLLLLGTANLAAIAAAFGLSGHAPGAWKLLTLYACFGWLVVVGVVQLVLLGIGRARGRSGKWLIGMAVVTVLAQGVPQLVSILFNPSDSTNAQLTTELVLMLLMVAALPMAIAAGVTFGELTVRAVTWSVLGLRSVFSRRGWLVLDAALVVGHGVLLWRSLPLGWATWVMSVVLTVAAMAASAVGLWLARRHNPMLPPRPTNLAEVVPDLAILLALPLGVRVFLMLFDQRLGFVSDALTVLVALVLTVRAVRRGNTPVACLAPVFLVGHLWFGLRFSGTLLVLPQDAVMHALLVLTLLVAGAWWAVRRRLDDRRLCLLTIGLLLILVFPWREILAEPVTALFGFTTTGVIIVGLVWRTLTDARFTRRHGIRFPADTRALLFAAHGLTVTTAMVASALVPSMGAYDLETQQVQGNAVMGRFLVIAVVVGLLELGRFDVDADPELEIPAHM